jgi:hypothetical protein
MKKLECVGPEMERSAEVLRPQESHVDRDTFVQHADFSTNKLNNNIIDGEID